MGHGHGPTKTRGSQNTLEKQVPLSWISTLFGSIAFASYEPGQPRSSGRGEPPVLLAPPTALRLHCAGDAAGESRAVHGRGPGGCGW